MRTCLGCEKSKPVEDFPRRGKRWHSRCKACMAAAQRERYAKDGGRAAHLKKSYGITVEQYNTMLANQGGVCATCKGGPNGRGGFHVDHDHATGRVRGILCHKCNVALGMVGDDPELLLALVAYLA